MKTIKRRSQTSSAGGRRQPFFRPAGSGRRRDESPFFRPGPAPALKASAPRIIQCQEDEEQKDPLTEGLKTVGKELVDKPEVEEQLDALKEGVKYNLWDRKSTAGKAALGGFGGLSLGMAGLAFAQSPGLREMLSGVDIGKLLSLIPYSPVEGLQYKLPGADESAYGLSADFTLNPLLELLREKDPNIPLSSLTFALETALGGGKGPSVTGGEFSLGVLDDALKVEGKSFSERSPYPALIPGALPGDPSSTLKQRVPGRQPTPTKPGFQVMVMADLMKLFPRFFGLPKR